MIQLFKQFPINKRLIKYTQEFFKSKVDTLHKMNEFLILIINNFSFQAILFYYNISLVINLNLDSDVKVPMGFINR